MALQRGTATTRAIALELVEDVAEGRRALLVHKRMHKAECEHVFSSFFFFVLVVVIVLFALVKCLCGVELCVVTQKFIVEALCLCCCGCCKAFFCCEGLCRRQYLSVQVGVAAEIFEFRDFTLEKQTFYGTLAAGGATWVSV